MNKLFYILLLLLSNSQNLFTQVQRINSNYKANIKLLDSEKTIKGYITKVKDSSFFLIESIANSDPIELNTNQIKSLKLRHKHAVRNGIFKGAAIGFGAGAIIGYTNGSDKGNLSSATDKALGVGLLLSIPGALIGGLAGTSSIKISLNGKKDRYSKYKKTIEKYANPNY